MDVKVNLFLSEWQKYRDINPKVLQLALGDINTCGCTLRVPMPLAMNTIT